jgi:hypothetical protein
LRLTHGLGETTELWPESMDPMWRSAIVVKNGLSGEGLETHVQAKVIWKYLKV